MLFDESDGVRLFDKPPAQPPLVSDLSLWRSVFSALKTAETEYSEKLSEIVRIIDSRCKEFFLGETSRKQADFNRFMNDLHHFRNEINKKSQRASNDGDQFGLDCVAIDNFKDDSIQNLDVDLNGSNYRDLKRTFDKTQRLLDKRKVKYETVSLDEEKLEIEMLRCKNEKKYMEMDAKMIEMERKVEKAEKDYRTIVERFQEERDLLITTSDQYEYFWKDREATRAQYMTKILYQSGKRRDRANQDRKEPRFKHLDTLSIMEDIGENIFIEDQQFQKYNKSCSQQIKRSILEKLQRARIEAADMSDDTILEEVMYANTTFKKLYQWQLSLNKGQKIRQIMPSNESGFAFGEIKDKHGKRTRGFYPAQCVSKQMVEHTKKTEPNVASKPRTNDAKKKEKSVKKSANRSKKSQPSGVFAKNKDEPDTLANPFLMSKEEWVEEKKKAAEALLKGLLE